MRTENQLKIAYKINIKKYLRELSCFSLRPITESDLLPVGQSNDILSRIRQLPKDDSHKFTIPFDEKYSVRFFAYIQQLYQTNPSSIYMWSDLSDVCGTCILNSITALNLEFSFDCSTEGIISFRTTDLKDKILFDFYEEDGQRWLDIETSGMNWPKIIWEKVP
jgi:hypothetical protein